MLSETGLGTSFTVALGSAAPAQQTEQTGQTGQTGQSQNNALTPQKPQLSQSAAIRLNLDAQGYDAEVKGLAGTARLRDLAYAFGMPHLDDADRFLGGTVDFDFAANGPWIGALDVAVNSSTNANSPGPVDRIAPEWSLKKSQANEPAATSAMEGLPEISLKQESFTASLLIHHAQWKASYLALPVGLAQAAIIASDSGIEFASDFSYGIAKESNNTGTQDAGLQEAIKGSVAVKASTGCTSSVCLPIVQLRLGSLDAETVQRVLLGAPEGKTLFSPLIDRMRSADRPKFPEMTVTVQADSLTIGPATLQKPLIRMQFKANDVTLEDWEAGLLGGSVKGTGHLNWNIGGKPEYALDGSFSRLNAGSLGSLLEAEWSGGTVSGSGKIQLSGLTAKDLASSASGEVRFDWPHGSLSTSPNASQATPSQEIRFEDWSGTVAIQGGKAQFGENALVAQKHRASLEGEIPFGGPVRLMIPASETRLASQSSQSESPHAVK
jgi:hypothetical protein